MKPTSFLATAGLAVCALAACGEATSPPATDTGTKVDAPSTKPDTQRTPIQLTVLGSGTVARGPFTAEVAVHGGRAYTSTWNYFASPGVAGNVINVWDVTGDAPRHLDTLQVAANVARTGDVNISDDGRIMVVPTEPTGMLHVYELAGTARPRQLVQWPVPSADGGGVHTAKLARVNGVLYAFAQLTARGWVSIIDLSTPAVPREIARISARAVIHDVFVRDGLVFASDIVASELVIWDIGGGNRGGSVTAPVRISSLPIPRAHNAWWFHDPTAAASARPKRYLFVGEEAAGSPAARTSSGDIHVVDVSDLAAPKAVAVYSVPSAGTHNFWMDEARGVLYAAYYNGGVRAIDVRGDLETCSGAQRSTRSGLTERCDLGKMGRELGVALTEGTYVWGIQVAGDALYASDMYNGLWKLRPVIR